MRYKFLKSVRVGLAAISILLISFAFIDFLELMPDSLIKGSLWMQFVPSVLLFSKVFALSAAGFLVVLVLTLFTGRVYCAAFCPLGILQDVVLRIARKHKKIRFKYQKPLNWVRYFILIFAIMTVLSGSLLILNLLDPYSLFGRIISDMIRPLIILANNLFAGILQSQDIYVLFDERLNLLNWTLYVTPFIFLFVIVYLTVHHGRLYCNTLCPVGTFLGFLSRFSVFKIRIDTDRCTDCKACARACKAECIDLKQHKIDDSRCISCFNCLTSCKFNAIDLSSKKHFSTAATDIEDKKAPDPSRRKALSMLLGAAIISPQSQDTTKKLVSYNATVPVHRKQYLTPPGSADVKEFLTKCTACHLCVSACPTHVIQPSKNEFGWGHIMQVRMDFFSGFCNYECQRCTEVCPTGALTSLKLEDKKLTQLGKAEFIQDNCIVETEGTDCGACSEHCPTKAVHMVPFEGNLSIPEVDDSICIGCGACEFACPTNPYKAIYVKGNAVHVLADKPKEEKAKKTEFEGDFPF